MAFILVIILLKPEDHSSMPSQIILLHVQSKVRNGIAAMQALHDAWQTFVMFYSLFRRAVRAVSLFWRARSYFASAE
jgi:nitrate reductase gamma subunit